MKPTRLTRALLFCLLTGLGVSSHAVAANTGFSMPIQDSFKITGRGTVLTGKISSGTLSVGYTVCVPLQSGARTVTGIESFRKLLEKAETGVNVGVLVGEVDSKQVKVKAVLNGNCE